MKNKRKTQAEKRHATREQLLDAAARVFARNGFHGTSLEAVGEEAGFSRGAVYYNFANKQDLFLELLTGDAERSVEVRKVFADTDDSIAATGERAQLAARQALDAMTGDPEWLALYLEFLAHAARDADFRREFARRTDEMRSTLEEVILERSRPIASAMPIDPHQLAAVLDALGVGLAAHHLLHGSNAVPPDLFSNAVSLLVDGIVARTGDPTPSEGSR